MPAETGMQRWFPRASPALRRFLDAASQQGMLLPADWFTARDLLEIARLDGNEPLCVLLAVSLLALEEGSLCVDLDPAKLQRRLAILVGAEDAKSWTERILAELPKALDTLIGVDEAGDRPLVLAKVGPRQLLYFHKCYHHERLFRAAWQKKVQEPASGKQAASDSIESSLDPDQQAALQLALRRNLAVISGGPGTGKTSLVLALLRSLVRAGVSITRIALAAPTGRAAQRLSQAIHDRLTDSTEDAPLKTIQATTLHQLLQYSPRTGQFRRHAENPIPADVVILDEVSMVGLVLLSQTLQALAPCTKLVLLGDKDQLPSVDAGAMLAHLVPANPPDYVAMLRTNHRSEPAIRQAAQALNAQDASLVTTLPTLASVKEAPATGCFLLPFGVNPQAELRQICQDWKERHFGAEFWTLVERTQINDDEPQDAKLVELFRRLDAGRLLTVLREGHFGCMEINAWFDRQLRPRTERGELFPGAPVLIVRNEHVRKLFNGDVGLTLSGRDGLRVVFARGSGFVSFPAESLPTHELGYALTVHKSQGSEYGEALTILPAVGGDRLLTKEILYTAITRARKLALIASAREVLEKTIARRIERDSGWQ